MLVACPKANPDGITIFIHSLNSLSKGIILIGRHQNYTFLKGVCAMTDTVNTSLNHENIIRLFDNSVCLTYDPLETMDAFLHAKNGLP